MSKTLFTAKLITALKQLAETGDTDSLNTILNDDSLSSDETEATRLLNTFIKNYQSATEYDLMKYKMANNALNIALWDMNVVNATPIDPNNEFTWSQEFRHMLGFSNESDFPNKLQSWSNRLHPEDKKNTLDAFAAHIIDRTGKAPYDVEYRLKLKNGEYRHFRAFGSTQRDNAGVPFRVAGALMDIHEQKLAEQARNRSDMSKALNKSTEIFCQHNEATLDDLMTSGIRPVADILDLDRICAFRHKYTNDDKHFDMIYMWDRAKGGTVPMEERLNTQFDNSILTRWVDILGKDAFINTRVCDMPEDEKICLSAFGVKTIFIMPVFTHGDLWGIITLQGHTTDTCLIDKSAGADLLQSAAYIFANAIIRNEANKRMELMLNSSPLSCQIWDKNGNNIDCNKAAIKLFRFNNKQELLEKYHTRYPEHQPDGQKSFEKNNAIMIKAFEDGYYTSDWLYNMPDGTTMLVEATFVRVPYVDGFVVVEYMRDLSEYTAMMREINQMTDLLQTVNHAATILLKSEDDENIEASLLASMELIGRAVDVDRVQIWRNEMRDGNLHVVNAYEWLCNAKGNELPVGVGYSLSYNEDLPGLKNLFLSDTYYSKVFSEMSPEDRKLFSQFNIKTLVFTPLFLNERFWGLFSMNDCVKERTFTEDDINILRSVSFMMASAIDRSSLIDNIKTRTNQLALQTTKLQTIIDSIPDWVFSKDLDLKYTLLNKSVVDYLGIDMNNAIGKGDVDGLKFPVEAAEEMIFADKKILNGSQTFVTENLISSYDGSIRFFETTKAPLIQDGVIVGLVGVSRDITEKKRTSEILEAALKQAEAGSRSKSNFLSTMSHEMRTPMNAIIGMTAIGTKATDIEEKNYALTKIGDASSHLLGVINDVLDMAKIEADKLELAPIEYNFERMLQKVSTVVNFRANERQQSLTINIDKQIPRFVVGDEQRLSQVITNLLSNAVKFTPKSGKIHVDAFLLDMADDMCELRIEVIDTGIGISLEKQKKLFHAFVQAESGTSREYGGTGLGLVISKRIIELMDGKIWIESEPGNGSKFIFTVKVLRGEKNPRSLLAPDINWETIRILVVDDILETREQFQDIFNSLDIKCDTAADGVEAYRIINERGGYDIYFIDWRMPRMDGIELTRKVKSRNGGKSSVVIMITAMDWEQIKFEAVRAGVDKHLLKPFFTTTVIDCVNECLGGSLCSRNEEAEEACGEFTGKRLLLAEDIEINREIIMALLEDTGLIIDCAKNGQEALDMVTASPSAYDIVFMDVQMPKMDGLKATRCIRALPSLQGISLPIIAMTANVFKSDIEECLVAGMNDHLGKPIDIDNVLETLKKYLGKQVNKQ